MLLRIKEYRTDISKLHNTRKKTLVSEEVISICEGYLGYTGARENYPYENLIFVKEIKDNEATIIMLNENERLREELTLKLNEEVVFTHKGPRGLPFSYSYYMTLEESV